MQRQEKFLPDSLFNDRRADDQVILDIRSVFNALRDSATADDTDPTGLLTALLPVRGNGDGTVAGTRKRGASALFVLNPDAVEELRLAVAGVELVCSGSNMAISVGCQVVRVIWRDGR